MGTIVSFQHDTAGTVTLQQVRHRQTSDPAPITTTSVTSTLAGIYQRCRPPGSTTQALPRLPAPTAGRRESRPLAIRGLRIA